MINRRFLGLTRASVGNCRVLYFFLVIWGFLEYFKFEKESRTTRTKSPPAGRKLGRQPVGKDSAVVERTAGDTTDRERYEKAPVCKEPPAAQAQGLRHQSKSRKRGEPGFEGNSG